MATIRFDLLSMVVAAGISPYPGARTDGGDAATLGTLRSAALRDTRHCELIVAGRDGPFAGATVYDTLGLNDCPEAEWQALTEDRARAALSVPQVVLNGPRYWVLDAVLADETSADGATIAVDGLAFAERVILEAGPGDLRQPYQELRISPATRWVYDAGRPMFLLTAPDGARYAMQSYARIVDAELEYADLPTLGPRLDLPEGWTYTVSIPSRQVVYPAAGEAIIVQDDLANTYQKLP